METQLLQLPRGIGKLAIHTPMTKSFWFQITFRFAGDLSGNEYKVQSIYFFLGSQSLGYPAGGQPGYPFEHTARVGPDGALLGALSPAKEQKEQISALEFVHRYIVRDCWS